MVVRLPMFVVLLAAWACLGVVSVFLLLPGVPGVLILATCGLAFPLLLLPTLWLYVTGVMGGLLVWTMRAPWFVVLSVIALGVAGAAFGPSVAGQAIRDRTLASLTRDDRDGSLPRAPRAVRLAETGYVPSQDRAAEATMCHGACQALLYGGEADAVEVLAIDAERGTHSTTWRRARQAACVDPFRTADAALPAVRRALAEGDCLVASPGELLPEAPWVRLERASWHDRKDLEIAPWLYALDRLVTVTAGPSGTALDSPAFRRTAVHARKARRPTVFVTSEVGGLSEMSLVPSTDEEKLTPTTWEEGLREAFGYAMAPLPEPGLPGFADVSRMLDRPGDTSFGPTAEDLVETLFHARHVGGAGPLTPEEVAVVDRMLRDPRLVDLASVASAVERDPSADSLVPALVSRVGLPHAADHPHTQASVARVLAQRDPERLRPHVPELLAAVRANPGWGTEPLLAVLPRLTDALGPDLAKALAEGGRAGEVAIRGVCNASPEIAVPLLPQVETLAAAARELPPEAIRALRRHGRADVAERLAAALDDPQRRRLERAAAQMETDPPSGGCRW